MEYYIMCNRGMMEKLTDAQWQELLEWAGFRIEQHPHGVFSTGPVNVIISPEGEAIPGSIGFPPKDMNTLFKWMVEKLKLENYTIVLIWRATECLWEVTITNIYRSEANFKVVVDSPYEFEALAQAIYKVGGDVALESKTRR